MEKIPTRPKAITKKWMKRLATAAIVVGTATIVVGTAVGTAIIGSLDSLRRKLYK